MGVGRQPDPTDLTIPITPDQKVSRFNSPNRIHL